MATLTYTDGFSINLAGVTAFEMKMHPGDANYYHIHAIGAGITESIWKRKHMEDAVRDRNDFTKYVIESGQDVKIDEDTGRVVPNV